jgi:hypothetical protein
MALIGANELKKKLMIEVDGQPFNVIDVFFATPTARGASTMVRTKLKKPSERRGPREDFPDQREVFRTGCRDRFCFLPLRRRGRISLHGRRLV